MSKTRFTAIPAIGLILRNQQNQILFLKRINIGHTDGLFGLPSGHVDGGESLKQDMAREAMEEIGIKIEAKDLKLVHVAHRFIINEPERIDFYFETNEYQGEIKNIEPHKCSELVWLDITDEGIVDYISAELYKIKDKENYSDFGFNF